MDLRAELYKHLYQRLIPAKLKCSSADAYNLRMARSKERPTNAKIKGLNVLDGYKMLLEDLDAYLKVAPDSALAFSARKSLERSRFLYLKGDTARELAYKTKNARFLDIYYEDLAKEIKDLQPRSELLLLGGPSDHTIVHRIQKGFDSKISLKTYNGGIGIDRHIKRGHLHHQTHVVKCVDQEKFTPAVMRDLFSHKAVRLAGKKNEEQRRQLTVIYDTIKKLGPSCLTDNPTSEHKANGANACIRSAFLYWLKEDSLQTEYQAFKVAFGTKAVLGTKNAKQKLLGTKRLDTWKKKCNDRIKTCTKSKPSPSQGILASKIALFIKSFIPGFS